jgi:2Fe-2S ferredoxin
MSAIAKPDECFIPEQEAAAVTIAITDREGGQVRITTTAGLSLQAAIRQAGLPIRSVCGGKKACGTCRVRVDPDWFTRLQPADQVEINLLNCLKGRSESDRLSCQIRITAALDGLAVTLDR